MAFGYRYWMVFLPEIDPDSYLLFVHNPASATTGHWVKARTPLFHRGNCGWQVRIVWHVSKKILA